MSDRNNEKTINVTTFKAQCLALIDAVARGKADRVVLTRRGRPVAAVVPYQHAVTTLWGALRGSVTVPPGVDLTAPTGEAWKVDA